MIFWSRGKGLNPSSHRLAASAVSVLVLVALVLGGCLACAQPVSNDAAAHPCCDPKGACKTAPAQMDHAKCERTEALLPDVAKPEFSLEAELLPLPADALCESASVPVSGVDTSPPRISPLEQSSLLRI
jgi:hypothetical protein